MSRQASVTRNNIVGEPAAHIAKGHCVVVRSGWNELVEAQPQGELAVVEVAVRRTPGKAGGGIRPSAG